MTPPPPASPIKVLHLGSPGPLYGAERWILALVRHLDPARIHSIVAAIKDEPGLEVSLCREAEKLGCEAHIFEAYGRFNFSAVRELRHHIKTHDINILHTHFYKTDLIGLLAAAGTTCRLVSTPHGWTNKADWKLRLYELVDRCLFSLFDAVVPLSDGLYRPLLRIPRMKNKLHLIQNGIDFSEMDAKTNTAPELAAWRQQGVFILGYVGRLVFGKGLDILFNALSQLRDLNWRLAIVGEGPQLQNLTMLAEELGLKDRICFFGFRPDRLSFIRGFDLFILPSRSEGTPRCLMEAMASHVPVIASDIPGCRNLISAGHNGLLFPLDMPERLSETISQLVGDSTLRQFLASNGRELVIERFSASRMASEYYNLYMSLSPKTDGVT